MTTLRAFGALGLAFWTSLAAGAAEVQDGDRLNLALDLPVLDLPFGAIYGPSSPSMRQSQAVTKDVYYLMSLAFDRTLAPRNPGVWHRLWTRTVVSFAEYYVYATLPFGGGWLHEEWHRAVMTRHRTQSHNGIYDFEGGSFTAVSGETDEDLARIKNGSNPDFVRLSAAGMEAETALAKELAKDAFFSRTRTWNGAQLFLLHFGPYGYMDECASSNADVLTEQQNLHDGDDVGKRDFTGLDCTGWVYDLFHEDEAYEERGTHPSGVGINRYRSYADLGDDGQAYIEAQVPLTLLNFVDPFLFGFAAFEAGGVRWNANLQHYMASFGHAIDANVFLEARRLRGLVTVHGYWNHERYFPGLEVQTFALPVALPVELDVRGSVWLQPENQRFFTEAAAAGGLVAVAAGPRLASGYRPYGEVVAKTAGWVSGNVHLDSNLSVQIGVSKIAF